jgi:hypothetical protein
LERETERGFYEREREREGEREVLMLVEFNFCCAIQVEFLKWTLHDLQAEFLEEFLELATFLVSFYSSKNVEKEANKCCALTLV